MTKLLLGLIGTGITGSLSPALHEEEGRHHGLRVHYQLIDLAGLATNESRLSCLIEAARDMGFAGLNITHPFKQSVIPLLDALSDDARAIGAVNTVVREGDRLVGHNTDGSGWSWGFQRSLPEADLDSVVLLGAGGAGSACGHAVLQLGARELVICDMDPQRAVALAARLNHHLGGTRARSGEDLQTALTHASGLIHATPVGMARSPGMPFTQTWLRPNLWLSEVVYVPLETALLRAARQIGCRTADGGNMNVGQAVRGFTLFTGLEADAARMDAHFRQLTA